MNTYVVVSININHKFSLLYGVIWAMPDVADLHHGEALPTEQIPIAMSLLSDSVDVAPPSAEMRTAEMGEDPFRTLDWFPEIPPISVAELPSSPSTLVPASSRLHSGSSSPSSGASDAPETANVDSMQELREAGDNMLSMTAEASENGQSVTAEASLDPRWSEGNILARIEDEMTSFSPTTEAALASLSLLTVRGEPVDHTRHERDARNAAFSCLRFLRTPRVDTLCKRCRCASYARSGCASLRTED